MIDQIAAEEYSLPSGRMPVIDGEPVWPWDPRVARTRLLRVAERLEIVLTGDEVQLESGSNDAWDLGGEILRICWRGDLDRIVREARLADTCPVPYPRPLAMDRDDELSWVLSPKVAGRPLGDVWSEAPESELRAIVRELAGMMRALHAWQPDVVRPPRVGDTALDIVRHALLPLTLDDQLTVVAHAAAMPYADRALLTEVATALTEAAVSVDFGTDEVFVHGDISPSNVLIADGRIVAILDHEWAGRAPRDADLLLPTCWATSVEPEHRPGRLLDWLQRDYPELFSAPDLELRLWVYQVAFALTSYLRWPMDAPEDRAESFCQRWLRELMNDR